MDGPEMDAMTKMMMASATTTISFQGRAARVETNMMAGMSTVAISNDDTEETVVLMNMMGRKMAMEPSKNVEDEAEKANVDIKKTGKSKEVAGYSCQELIVTPEEGEPVTLWVTEKIAPNSAGTDFSFKGVKGFPLEMTINQEGNIVKMVAQKVSTEKMDASLFSTEIPDGYKVMTEEEMMQMGGGK